MIGCLVSLAMTPFRLDGIQEESSNSEAVASEIVIAVR
jgi:hypothetical protein